MMGGMGGGHAAAERKGKDVRKENRAEIRKEQEEQAGKAKGPSFFDPYFDIVQVTVYGQARFFLPPPPLDPSEQPSPGQTPATPDAAATAAASSAAPGPDGKTAASPSSSPAAPDSEAKAAAPAPLGTLPPRPRRGADDAAESGGPASRGNRCQKRRGTGRGRQVGGPVRRTQERHWRGFAQVVIDSTAVLAESRT